MFSDTLVSHFQKARLDLKVTGAPLVNAGNQAIVQLDIARAPEQFLLWKGDRNNIVTVQGTDRKLRQLVLFVQEPRRAFEVRVRREELAGRMLLREDRNKNFVWAREFTNEARRHLLCGMDEQHYFVAQLPWGVSTVHEAHRALENPSVRQAAQKAGAKVIRQGEWFIVRASPAELKALTPLLGKSLQVRQNMRTTDGTNAFRRGRPHIVNQLVQVKHAVRPLVEDAVFVRGKIRHPDHRVINFSEWHRVFGNAEASQPVGVQWAD